MKTICAIQASFQETPLGMGSRLADVMAGTAILRRTVQRVCAVTGIEGVFVLAPESRAGQCRDLLAGLDVVVQSITCDPPPWARLVRASRKWSLDGWRGGVGGSTVFDEFTDCRVLSGLLELCPADAVLSVPAAAPLLDPELASQMIRHRQEHRDEARLTFTQAVPGVAGIVLDASLVRELAANCIPISWLFSYKPDQPQKDLIFQAACLDIDAPLRFAAGRLIADTNRTMRTLSIMLARKESWNLAEIGEFLLHFDERGTDSFPREIEIELTTDDPFPDALLAPRGLQLERSGSMDIGLVRKIAKEISQHDDALCVLGGFGDPLRYPELEGVLEIFRPRNGPSNASGGVFGLCVRTSGADLTPLISRVLIEHQVDILNVMVDAWTEETFRRVKGLDSDAASGLSIILQNLETFAAIQREQLSPTPILVPEMTKAQENVGELDSFFDGWLRRSGAVSVAGYSHYAGQMPDRGVMDMRPPQRIPCRRLRTRCMILADGRVALCDQDYKGLQTFGNVRDSTIAEIWESAALQTRRQNHLEGKFEVGPLCHRCSEWHRP